MVGGGAVRPDAGRGNTLLEQAPKWLIYIGGLWLAGLGLLLVGLGAGLAAAVAGGGLLLALATVASMAQQVRIVWRAYARRPPP